MIVGNFAAVDQPDVLLALSPYHAIYFMLEHRRIGSFYLSRRTLRPAAKSSMPQWQHRFFIGLARSASDATDFFQIPTGRDSGRGIARLRISVF
jgi:KUP system potassium uptake protein